MEKTNLLNNKWFQLICGSLGTLMIGVIYAWSILKAPLAEEFGWSVSGLALNFTLTLCFFCVGGVIGSKLSAKTSPKITILVSAVLLFLGFFLCSRLNGSSILLLYLFYAVFGGCGIGMANNAIVSQVNSWFPGKTGTSTGVLMMCFGFSALLLGKLADILIAIPEIGWRNTYVVIAICMAVILVPIAFILKYIPEELKDKTVMSAQISESAEPTVKKDYTTPEMIARSSFKKFYLYSILTCAVGSTVISFARDLALSVGASAALAATLVGVLSVCNGIGRIAFGLVFDKLGRKNTMLLSNILTIVAPLIVLVSLFAHSLPLNIIGFCLTGIAYGSSPTISAATASELYGTKYFASNYSVVNTMVIFASLMSTVAGKLIEVTNGDYVPVFIILLVLPIIALFLNFSIKEA